MGWAFGLLAVLAGALALVMGAVVLWAAPRAAPNRRLALVLVIDAILSGFGNGLPFFAPSEDVARVFRLIAYSGLLVMTAAYLRFVATLDTPFVRPLRTRTADALFLAWAMASPIVVFSFADAFLGGTVATRYSAWEGIPGAAALWATRLLGIAALVALGAALHAMSRAPRGSEQRRQLRAYVGAFGLREALAGALLLGVFPMRLIDSGGLWSILWFQGMPLVTILFVVMVAHAMLRTQLFDLELRLKRGLRRGIVAGAFLAVFLVASNVAQEYVSASLGWLSAGVATAGLLLVLGPLQRVAARMADTALPGVAPTPEYLSYRKMVVYRAAVETSLSDGDLSAKDRLVLSRLREELDIGIPDALAVEADVRRLRAHASP